MERVVASVNALTRFAEMASVDHGFGPSDSAARASHMFFSVGNFVPKSEYASKVPGIRSPLVL